MGMTAVVQAVGVSSLHAIVKCHGYLCQFWLVSQGLFYWRALSDLQWKDEPWRLFGAIVFEQDDLLVGLNL